MKAGYLLLMVIPAILIFTVLLTFVDLLGEGAFGLAPMVSNHCAGLKVNSDEIERIFPKGKSRYEGFIRFQYLVPDKPLSKGRKYCLGQSVLF